MADTLVPMLDCFARWRSLCPMARSTRRDVRLRAAVFVEPAEMTFSENLLQAHAFRRLLLQIGGANIASADR